MTNQEIFDTVARHLLKQGARSITPMGRCAYRGNGGLRCAVGVLIPDDVYCTAIEDSVVSALDGERLYHDNNAALLQVLIECGIESDAYVLLEDLQRVHDHEEVEDWSDELRDVADGHALSPAVLDEPRP